MVNPETSSEKVSEVQMSQSDFHDSGVIEILSDPQSYELSEHGLIIVSRYQQMQDGSFHFSIKMKQDWGSFGAFVRYLDQFNYYKLKIVPYDSKW